MTQPILSHLSIVDEFNIAKKYDWIENPIVALEIHRQIRYELPPLPINEELRPTGRISAKNIRYISALLDESTHFFSEQELFTLTTQISTIDTHLRPKKENMVYLIIGAACILLTLTVFGVLSLLSNTYVFIVLPIGLGLTLFCLFIALLLVRRNELQKIEIYHQIALCIKDRITQIHTIKNECADIITRN